MGKQRTIYVCQKCGCQSPKWVGRCPECGAWNSMVETLVSIQAGTSRLANRGKSKAAKPLKLSEIEKKKLTRLKTGTGEFDRVLGGGIVPGSVVLLAGEPGIGKSTLLTQIIAKVGGFDSRRTGLYVSAEESPQQIKIRTKRLKVKEEKFLIFSVKKAIDLYITIQQFSHLSIVIIDSIQSMAANDLTGTAGSIGQVRECANRLLQIAKKTNIAIFIIGHITKTGAIAGPKVLEHLVDVVLYLEGDRSHNFRILRAHKNRFGAIDEVGLFEMKEEGMIEIDSPSKLFLSNRVKKVPGSAVAVVLQGVRPVLVEVQALVVPTSLIVPRRVANGISFRRLQLLSAVLQKRSRLPLNKFDVYLNIVGGLKIDEPAVDLAVCLAIASSLKNKIISQNIVFIAEVGLLGELREVSQIEKRVNEATRLGFSQAMTAEKYNSISEVIKKILH